MLLPRVLYNLHKRNMLYGLRDLLIGHHERFRPLRMLSPEADDILVPGQQVTIQWSMVPSPNPNPEQVVYVFLFYVILLTLNRSRVLHRE